MVAPTTSTSDLLFVVSYLRGVSAWFGRPAQTCQSKIVQELVRYYEAGGDKLAVDAPEVVSFASYCGLTMHYLHRKLWVPE